jgi:hypothetical protein
MSERNNGIAMKNTIFWDVAPCRYFVNRRFRGTVFFIVIAVKTSNLTNGIAMFVDPNVCNSMITSDSGAMIMTVPVLKYNFYL